MFEIQRQVGVSQHMTHSTTYIRQLEIEKKDELESVEGGPILEVNQTHLKP